LEELLGQPDRIGHDSNQLQTFNSCIFNDPPYGTPVEKATAADYAAKCPAMGATRS
jgi:hypothetical protein